jgi:hypothetical protein
VRLLGVALYVLPPNRYMAAEFFRCCNGAGLVVTIRSRAFKFAPHPADTRSCSPSNARMFRNFGAERSVSR